MTLLLRAASLLWWLSVGLWLSVIVTAGISAAFVFGNLKQSGLVLPDHPVSDALHWRYAAGRVMIDVFTTVDIGQAVSAVLGLAGLIGLALAAPAMRRRTSFRVQAAAFLVACGSFGVYAFTVAPPMNAGLRDQWAAARAGDEAEAERLRADFDASHQTANRLFSLTLTGVAVAGAAAAIGAAPTAAVRTGSGAGAGSALEEPRLAGRRS